MSEKQEQNSDNTKPEQDPMFGKNEFWDAVKKLENANLNYRVIPYGQCPSCGYCPTCGRANQFQYPTYPPYSPYFGPVWTSSGTQI